MAAITTAAAAISSVAVAISIAIIVAGIEIAVAVTVAIAGIAVAVQIAIVVAGVAIAVEITVAVSGVSVTVEITVAVSGVSVAVEIAVAVSGITVAIAVSIATTFRGCGESRQRYQERRYQQEIFHVLTPTGTKQSRSDQFPAVAQSGRRRLFAQILYTTAKLRTSQSEFTIQPKCIGRALNH